MIQYNLYSLSNARLFSLLLHVAKQKEKSYLLSAQQTCCALSGNSLFKSRVLQNENQQQTAIERSLWEDGALMVFRLGLSLIVE